VVDCFPQAGAARFEPERLQVRRFGPGSRFATGGRMSGKWMVWVLALGLTTTLLNLAIFIAQITTPASARTSASAAKMLDDEDFTDGLTKIVRKTVRDYCTVGKRNAIDC
jgi:hypothetical protein